MAEIKKYTSSAEIQNAWISNIAPNYFDLDKTNNYRSGIFGYVNEVMSTSVSDVFNAVNITRREFYPVSAQHEQSIYKMAALQGIDLPMATPGTCQAILLLKRDEVIENSTYRNNVYTCVIDNTAQIIADNIPFVLLYPIVILSKNTNGNWTHTVHYDKGYSNSLDTEGIGYYINNKTIYQEGTTYLLLSVTLKQATMEVVPQLVTRDTLVQTVSLLFPFKGDLAGFEVFYLEEPDSSTPIQLKKLLQGQSIIEDPFCYYQLLNSNLLELTFPRNAYFTPNLNAEIELHVYTSLGKEGNFPVFNGSLACSLDSERYPYNANISVLGVINGACKGGKNLPTFEQYTKKVQNAYSTNNVITTANDLQLAFNEISDDDRNRVKFRKKRSDIMYRLFGAYTLLKDKNDNVVPTNTLTLRMTLEEFDTYNGTIERAVIRPGAIFEYDESSFDQDIYIAKRVEDITLIEDLTSYDMEGRFLYTNPFLITATLYPNVVGYYYNAINEVRSVEYSYINDDSVVQFIGSNLTLYRNSIAGENYYTISLTISPTSDVSPEDVVEVPDPESDEDYYFRAEQNGRVIDMIYSEECVTCTIEYEDGETDEIQVSSYVEFDEEEDVYVYHPGYAMRYNMYDTFVEGDIIASKKVEDKGKIRACLNFQNLLYENGLYIPMTIEEYDEELNVYTLVGYISTDDLMDNGLLLIDDGIYDVSGHEDEDVSIPYQNLKCEVNVFYQLEDTNYTHKYSAFDYFRMHTLTNSYLDASDDALNLIQNISFIKSDILFSPGEDDPENEDEFLITIKEVPLAKAGWIKEKRNFDYLVSAITENYRKLQDLYLSLENNFSIDMKFYNTYGRSQFFRVGLRNNWQRLTHVNCSFSFGVNLSSIATKKTFISQFRSYIKEKIEAINASYGTAQSIYIMNLIHDIKERFSEIGFIEYYGFDEYGHEVQKIEPIPTSEMSPDLLLNYIPEFINLGTVYEDGENVPNIQVEFLNIVEE